VTDLRSASGLEGPASASAHRAHSSITRHDFGLTYELLKEAGGLLVGSDVAIDIDAEAIRPQ
jgi:hypothetical protein